MKESKNLLETPIETAFGKFGYLREVFDGTAAEIKRVLELLL